MAKESILPPAVLVLGEALRPIARKMEKRMRQAPIRRERQRVDVLEFPPGEPDGGEERTLVDGIEGGNLAGDIEGMAIYYGAGTGGYLVVSDQGINSFAVYRREGDNAYLGQFRVVADASAGIDGVSETDGLDVTSANLGPAFAHGLFIAQDGRNIAPAERQNFKLVPWQRIAAATGLETYSGFDPRAPMATQ